MGGSNSKEGGKQIITRGKDNSLHLAPAHVAHYREYMPNFCPDEVIVRPEMEVTIKELWDVVMQGTSAYDEQLYSSPMEFFYETFYETLFERAPHFRILFRGSLSMQGRALAGTISSLAQLFRNSNIVEKTQFLATRHAAFGVQHAHYEVFGQVMLQTLELVSAEEWTQETNTAFATAYCFLMYAMIPSILNTPVSRCELCLNGTITNKVEVATNMFKLNIDVPRRIGFSAGDAILVGVNSLPGMPDTNFRYFTLINVGHTEKSSMTLEFIIDAVSATSKWVTGQPIGGTLNIYWVRSKFVRELTQDYFTLKKKVAFIGIDIGVSPMLSIARGYQSADTLQEVNGVFLQIRQEEEAFLTTEMESLETEWTNFSHKEAVGIENLQVVLSEEIPDIASRLVYFSCRPENEKATIKALIDLGVSGENQRLFSLTLPTFNYLHTLKKKSVDANNCADSHIQQN